ncbi:MAG: hypothetical protein WA160_02765 [Pseudobdellovibrio sp.]
MLSIGATVSMAIIGAIVFMALGLSNQVDKFQQMSIEKNNIIFLRDYINFMVKNPTSLSSTLSIGDTDLTCNQTLQCVYHHTDCSVALAAAVGVDVDGNPLTGPTAFHEINCLYDTTGTNIVFRSALPTNGFNANVIPCNTYTTNDACSFRPEVRWRPLCATSACANAGFEIRIEIKVSSSGAKTKLNTAKRVAREIIYY